MKIYTKTGDDGTTGLFSGGRVPKHHLRVEAYGTVDEVNSHIGVARIHKPTDEIETALYTIQEHLFRLGADLATPMDAKAEWLVRITPDEIAWVENNIDKLSESLDALKHFILPGGTIVSANLHIARTVCRRAERVVVALSEDEAINNDALIYLNRLSDWFFTAARYENKQANIAEDKWVVRGE